MPALSQRVIHAHASPIRKLTPYAEKAKADGKHVYHLNIGQPDLHTPQKALEQLKSADIDVLAYGHSEGRLSYRSKLAAHYRIFDIDVTPDQIMVTSGASEAILLLMLAALDPGESVIIPEPFYSNYTGFAEMAGINIIPITTNISDDFQLPHVSAFEEKITEDTKAILLCNPNNPTGSLYTKEALKALAELAKKHDLFLIVDEVYRVFSYEEAFYSALRLRDVEEHVIVIDSISKKYSACGARIGGVTTRNSELLAGVIKLGQTRLCAPILSQILAEGLLDDDATYLESAKEEYRNRRALLYDRLSKMEGVKSYLPGGAFYIFAELPIDDGDTFCKWLLESFDHQGCTVMLSPGSGFYLTPGLGKREVRIAYVLNCDDLTKAMDCLEVALVEYRTLVMRTK